MIRFLDILQFLSAAGVVICLVGFAKKLAPRRIMAAGAGGCLALLVGAWSLGGYIEWSEKQAALARQEAAAKAGGFESIEQMTAAHKVGARTRADWDAYLAAEEERAAEARERAEQEKRAEAERQCRQDLKCWGERFFPAATSRCRRPVERLAKHDFQWTDGMLEPKFSHYRWRDQAAGVVTYLGDRIKFQNAFGAWTHHVYECDFDTAAGQPLAVRARPGRIE